MNQVIQVNSRKELRPYTRTQIAVQRLMGQAIDEETGKPLLQKQIAKIVKVDPATISRWINADRARWYAEVCRYADEALEKDWPLILKAQIREALVGKSKVGAFNNLAKMRGKIGPDTLVDQSRTTVVAQVVVRLPENGRRGPEPSIREQVIEERKRFKLEELTEEPGGNGDGDE